MYIIILCTMLHHILLRYISYAYNISIAYESNSVELPIYLFIIIIIIMYRMIVFSNYNFFY